MSMAAWCCVLSIWLVQAYFVAELYRGLELLYIIIVLYTVYDGVIWFPQIWKNFDLFVPLPVRLDDPRKPWMDPQLLASWTTQKHTGAAERCPSWKVFSPVNRRGSFPCVGLEECGQGKRGRSNGFEERTEGKRRYGGRC